MRIECVRVAVRDNSVTKTRMKKMDLPGMAFLVVDVILVAYVGLLIYGYNLTSQACFDTEPPSGPMQHVAFHPVSRERCQHRSDPVEWLVVAVESIVGK